MIASGHNSIWVHYATGENIINDLQPLPGHSGSPLFAQQTDSFVGYCIDDFFVHIGQTKT